MKYFSVIFYCLLSLFFYGCSQAKEEEEVNIDQMVLNEEEEVEWTSIDYSGGDKIAGEPDLMPQEMVILETPDGEPSFDLQVR